MRLYQRERADLIILALTSQVRPQNTVGEVQVKDWKQAAAQGFRDEAGDRHHRARIGAKETGQALDRGSAQLALGNHTDHRLAFIEIAIIEPLAALQEIIKGTCESVYAVRVRMASAA